MAMHFALNKMVMPLYKLHYKLVMQKCLYKRVNKILDGVKALRHRLNNNDGMLREKLRR